MRFKAFFIIIIFVTIPVITFAQPDPGPGGDRVPISSGIIYLILMAFGVGIKYFSKKKKKD